MKNFKLLLGAAVVFAVGSAFTASNNKVAGEYILQGSTYVQVAHTCEEAPSEICDYTKTGSATTPQYPDQYKNPANFTPNRLNGRPVTD
ncbi:hypothetical protein CEQ15_11205 [Chryseobacterium indologenes]|uniref:DUF6520 family protein n=1 Tax=Chryseobacterium indologenes TaxID=253 RepID=UPI000B5150D4|nr:DUF6520 family protein [Chryseobacterium indologenes]ASE62015.1 hypothetical protein CEQ15_11205 [Chryseobacterium indologenes]